jgi:hypothetical protein
MKYLLVLFILFSISFVSAEVTYEISWNEEDVVNGREFKIIVDVDGENDVLYDGKLSIESKGKIISDSYNSKTDRWKSSYYYINEFFSDGENEIILRIDEEYSDFSGETFIYFKVRGEDQVGNGIEVLGKNEPSDIAEYDKASDPAGDNNILEEVNNDNLKEVEEVVLEPISLGAKIDTVEEKDINSENIVYESKGFKIIEYSVYGFAVLCVLLCVLVIWRKLD